MRPCILWLAVAFAVAGVFLPCEAARAEPRLLSVSDSGDAGNGDSGRPTLSADAQTIVFESDAGNLVSGDQNRKRDVFARDLPTGHTFRVSEGPGGEEVNRPGFAPAVSADGRFVAFASDGALVPGDHNHRRDVFVKDLDTGEIDLVSIAADGTQGNRDSDSPAISADGRYVAFASLATNLISGDTNHRRDVFVFDREERALRRVSVSTIGTQANGISRGPGISGDGRYVVFESRAVNLDPRDTDRRWDVYLHDLETGTTELVGHEESPQGFRRRSRHPGISGDGAFIVYETRSYRSGDDEGEEGDDGESDESESVPTQIAVYDVAHGIASVITADPAIGLQERCNRLPTVSDDGRFIVFRSVVPSLDERDEEDGGPRREIWVL